MSGVCGACGTNIVGPHIKAFGMQWCVNHLVCKVCHKDFADGTRVCEGQDGFAYCPDDWLATFCPQCPSCKKPIQGPVINALNKTWHPDCFKCAECDLKLTGTFFPSETGMPLCEQHYYDAMGLLCGGCGNPIISGKVITTKGDAGSRPVKYHVECFKCSYCKKNMAGQKYVKHKGKAYCQPCHLALF